MNLRKHLAGSAVFLLILSAWLMYDRVNSRARHPSDEALIANFNEHRAAFETLIHMTNQDGDVSSIYSRDFGDSEYRVFLTEYRVWPKNCSSCFSAQRWNEYQSAFANLGDVKLNILSKSLEKVQLPVSFQFTEVDANYEYLVSEKGYVYSLTEPPGVVESLNDIGFETRGTFYKKIANHWYLFHEWGVGKPE